MLRNKHLIYLILVLFIISCGNEQKIKPLSNEQLLARALSNNDFHTVQSIRPLIRHTENMQNIIKLYEYLYKEKSVALKNELNYTTQFYPQMNEFQKYIIDEISVWVYLMQMYKHEISPPVRILQREVLYLAPSKIDFSACPNASSKACATVARSKISSLLTNESIVETLKQMARKDPCVNLSGRLQGERIANRCLKKSKSSLEVVLLPLPRFNATQWLQALNSEN